MKGTDNNKWLDDALAEAIGSEKSEPDFEKWQREHPKAAEMLTTRAGRPRSGATRLHNIRTIAMKSKIVKLAAAAVIIIVVAFGIKTLSSLRDIDEPDTGVQVVKTDENKTTQASTNERAKLRAEAEQIEQMFAAHDVDGLIKMLRDGESASKVLAANYLAKIGDSRAIERLEELSAEWSGTEQDNPYAAAIREIKEQLEQETTDTVAKGSKDSIKEKVVKVPVPGAEIAGSGSVYDHFLFTRRNGPDSREMTKTLVLAKVTADGFELRDIDTRPKGSYPWEHSLCVVGGTLYCIEDRYGDKSLKWINLTTGETGKMENLPSLSSDHDRSGYCYDEGRLYGQAGNNEDAMTLRVLDFRKAAYRDIAALDDELERTTLAVSPDHKHLAYFDEDPNGQLLTVVDIESGQITQPVEPIEFQLPMISSLSGHGAPLVWVDTKTILFIRTEVIREDPNSLFDGNAAHKVAVVDVTTGEMEDIVPLPGNPYARFARMTQKYKQAGPRIWISNFGQFSIDLAERKVIEDETVIGDYLVSEEYLFYGEQELGPVQWDGRKDMEVSPDGKRTIWISEGKLLYHDSAGETVVPVIEDGNAAGGLLWLKAEYLKAPTVAADIPAGWIAFKDRPSEAEDDDDDARRSCWRDRKDIKDHLVLTVETDKDTYLLHEPVEVTLTFTSTTDANIEVASSRVIRLDIDYSGGSKDIECPVGPYEPNVETIVLGPGESISAADTLEIALVGDYKIRCEYGRFEDPWRGEVEDDVAFRVNPVGSPEQEQQLFEAKFSRLTARFRRELSTEYYDWSWVNAMVRDEIVGMAGMGPNVAPYLTEALKVEESEDVREKLYQVLTPLAGVEYLPFFQDRLAHGDGAEDESGAVCGWLYDLYRKGQDGSAEALATLLSAMSHEKVGVRREVAAHLKSIYDPNIETCFERAIDDEDEQVHTIAACYLAAAEWLDLDEWLDVAAKTPTKARYLAARSIIEKLEKSWNITKGDLPNVSWEQASVNPETLEQFCRVVRAWQQWASENVRFSSQFFDRDREHWLTEPVQ